MQLDVSNLDRAPLAQHLCFPRCSEQARQGIPGERSVRGRNCGLRAAQHEATEWCRGSSEGREVDNGPFEGL